MKNRKGQLATLSPAIVTLVVAIIALVLGLVIVQELRDTDFLSKGETGDISNETTNAVNHSGVYLTQYVRPAVICTISTVYNKSGGVIASTNYSQTGIGNCRLNFTDGISGGYNNSRWNVTYSFSAGGESWSGANESLVGLVTFGDFIPIIVLAVIASIVIGLIFVGFGRRTNQ